MGERGKAAPTPKREILLRLERIAEGLRDGGYVEEAASLGAVIRSLKTSIGKDASIQEVVLRALGGVIQGEVTLGGRLVDALVFVAKRYGAVLAMHPALLVAVAFGGQENPDRQDPEKSRILDAVLSAIVEEPAPYQESLYTLALFARQSGLDDTADMAVDMLHRIHEGGAETMADQAREIELHSATKPETPADDDLGWVIKTILTLSSLALVAASAAAMAGAVKDALATIDEVLGMLE